MMRSCETNPSLLNRQLRNELIWRTKSELRNELDVEEANSRTERCIGGFATRSQLGHLGYEICEQSQLRAVLGNLKKRTHLLL